MWHEWDLNPHGLDQIPFALLTEALATLIFFMKRTFFEVFLPIIYTKMLVNSDENGNFQKWFQKRSLLKMTGENGGF